MSVLPEEEFPKMALPTKIPSSSFSCHPTPDLLTPPASLPDTIQYLKGPGPPSSVDYDPQHISDYGGMSSLDASSPPALTSVTSTPVMFTPAMSMTAASTPGMITPPDDEMRKRMVTKWVHDNTYHHKSFSIDTLATIVRTKQLSVIVMVPAREVASTVGGVLDHTVKPLVDAGIVTKVYAIAANSKDGTDAVAKAHGAELIQRANVASELGSSQGKGDAMWRGLLATSRGESKLVPGPNGTSQVVWQGNNSQEIIAFLDGDTADPSPAHLTGIIGPLIMNDSLQLVKGCFERPFKTGSGEIRANDGGRVTELAARPLLNLHFPELAGFSQPLAGEFAARRGLLENLKFPVGYGIEIGTLIDTWRLVGLKALAQSDLGTRQNDHKGLRDLGSMAFAVTSTVERRVKRYNPFDTTIIPNEIYLPWEGQHKVVSSAERPSIWDYTAGTNPTMNLPCPPFLEINGVRNLRDIGGYSTTPGHYVRRNLVYRSGDFKDLTKLGEEKVAALNIKAIFDLRSRSEVEKARVNGGETYYETLLAPESKRPLREEVSVFSDQDYSPEATAIRFRDYASEGTEGFERAYNSILQNAGKAVVAIFDHLASSPDPGPILVHCTAGKDRTGVIVMILLLLAGCSPVTVAKEYSLTEMGLGTEWRADAVGRLSKLEVFKGADPSGIERMVGAREEVMAAVINNLTRDFGGVEGYLAAVGVSEEKVKVVKMLLQDTQGAALMDFSEG